MPFYKIPMLQAPQEFSVRLQGISYRFKLLYRNVLNGGWYLDILTEGGQSLVHGMAVVPGLDMLGQYEYLGLGVELYIVVDGDIFKAPSFEDIGLHAFLYVWAEDATIAELQSA